MMGVKIVIFTEIRHLVEEWSPFCLFFDLKNCPIWQLDCTRPLPYCFGTCVVLFKSYAKNFRVWISSFFKAYTPCLQCFSHNLFSFKFWANLTSKNVGGKSYFSSLVCSLALEFNNKIFTKMWSTFSCHVWFLWFFYSLFPKSSSKCWCMVCSKKFLWKHVNQLCLHSPSVIMWFKT